MAINFIGGPDVLRGKSGKETKIPAFVDGAANKNEKKLGWLIESGGGEISADGKYTAPRVLEDSIAVVLAYSDLDRSKFKRFTINIEAPKFTIRPSRNLAALSGGELKLEADFEGAHMNVRWEIINFGRGKGNIETTTGVYKAPEVIDTARDVEIRALERNSGKEANVQIRLIPIVLRDTYVGVLEVNAGGKVIQLPIESHNDLTGLDNFTGKIISQPIFGVMNDGGKYVTPLFVGRDTTVEIETVSKLDQSKKLRFVFTVKPPKCPVHNTEVKPDGRCPAAGCKHKARRTA